LVRRLRIVYLFDIFSRVSLLDARVSLLRWHFKHLLGADSLHGALLGPTIVKALARLRRLEPLCLALWQQLLRVSFAHARGEIEETEDRGHEGRFLLHRLGLLVILWQAKMLSVGLMQLAEGVRHHDIGCLVTI